MSMLSLSKLLSDDVDEVLHNRIQKGKKEIIKSKKKLITIADTYNNKYANEIAEGTKKRQLLLEAHAGEKEEDVLAKYGQFIPSIHTPILNFLYFFINEGYNTEEELEREIQNEKYGMLFEDIKYSKAVNEPKDMEQYVYGNCTHKTFQTIKKLKRLSRSVANEHEASAAYIACIKMCEKHNLDFDRIPI